MIGTADFETIVRENDCRVWAFGVCEIGNESNFIYGNSIEDFFKFCSNSKVNHTLYFHNLKFDGIFLLSYLLQKGFKHVTDKKKIKTKTFTTLISDMGQFYKIEVFFKKDRENKNTNKVTFLDSKKILNFSVDQIAKDFHLPVKKLNLGKYSPWGVFKKNKINKIKIKNIKFTRDEEDFIHDDYIFFNDMKNIKSFALFRKQKTKEHMRKIFKRKKQDIKFMDLGYKGYRKIGHKLTEHEIIYLRNDCEVMARALNHMFELNLLKMTIGADALDEYKNVLTKKVFDRHFKPLNLGEDRDIRKSYRGGFTYLNPIYENQIVEGGIVLDVNSLYPSIMYYESLPYGRPIFYEGKYVKDDVYTLYMQVIRCQFELKEGKIPTIQIKENDGYFMANEYLTSSHTIYGFDTEVTLILTSPDLELFLENYKTYNLEYCCGYKFKASNRLFKKYIDKWINVKIDSKANGNYAMEKIAKLMLNSLYGKFATNPICKSKIPFMKDNILHFTLGEIEVRNPLYVALASFVTSYGRCKTIRAAEELGENFIYADTDSLHIKGYNIPSTLEIDDFKLGAWKHEFTFDRGKYLRQKSYMEYGKDPFKEEEKYLKIVCAGMTKKSYKYVNFENFKIGSSFKGKLQPKIVKGGVVLQDTTFTIKSHSFF